MDVQKLLRPLYEERARIEDAFPVLETLKDGWGSDERVRPSGCRRRAGRKSS